MAHTKAQGSVKGNRDSRPKSRGVKLYGGQKVSPGNIIVRQLGTKFFAGNGVGMGKDYTLFSLISGILHFKTLRGKKIIEVMHG
jgi:large subunit ribosomal protein L27